MTIERQVATAIMNWVVAEGNDPTVKDCCDFALELIALIKGEGVTERKAITDWLRSRKASEPMRLTIERLAYLIDQGKHLDGECQKDNESVVFLTEGENK